MRKLLRIWVNWKLPEVSEQALDASSVEEPAVVVAEPEETTWTLEALLKTVSELVSDVSAFPAHALKPSQRLSADLGFDSLMFVELSSKVDAEFENLEGGIPQSLMSEQTSIQDIAEHLTDALNNAADGHGRRRNHRRHSDALSTGVGKASHQSPASIG